MQALSTAADSASPLAFAWHSGRREWTNFSFRRHRHFDAFLRSYFHHGAMMIIILLTTMSMLTAQFSDALRCILPFIGMITATDTLSDMTTTTVMSTI